jgi:hypothetical protein
VVALLGLVVAFLHLAAGPSRRRRQAGPENPCG